MQTHKRTTEPTNQPNKESVEYQFCVSHFVHLLLLLLKYLLSVCTCAEVSLNLGSAPHNIDDVVVDGDHNSNSVLCLVVLV